MNQVKPYEEVALGKKEQVRRMFNSISGRYDFMNRLLTMRIDGLWRRNAVKLVKKYSTSAGISSGKGGLFLDAGTGTGDFAVELARLKPRKIIGIDIADAMLALGSKKIKHKGLDSVIEFKEGDCENLQFPSDTFDLVASAFGVRNFEDLEKGLSEILRVLKPEGIIVILECSEPGNMPFKRLYKAYMNRICPAIGGIFSENNAYSYLNRSVSMFPTGKEFQIILEKVGFLDTRFIPQNMGIASIYIAKKRAIGK